MRRDEFAFYKHAFITAAKIILETDHSTNIYEAAFPAYCNPNPYMNFLFWERIYLTLKYISGLKHEPSQVMDFGCGGGVLLPILSKIADTVYAVDVDLKPSQKIGVYLPFAENIIFSTTFDQISHNSLDLILALDVLEHVDDLENILKHLCSLLTPHGKIIVSGPTENFAYKLGRALAGSDYSGEYHVRNIYEIEHALRKFAMVETIATLYYPVPIFKIYLGKIKFPQKVIH